MRTHKLLLDDVFKENFFVLAIYTNEKDYRLAYLLNNLLKIKLQKSASIIDKKKNTEFCVFEYDEKSLYRKWFLINNQCLMEKEVNNEHDLFTHNTALFQQKGFYLKKYKHAQYLLKVEVENPFNYNNELLKEILQIPQVYTVELIDLKLIKNKELLIF